MAYGSAPVMELPLAGQAALRNIKDAGLEDIVHLPGSEFYEARTKSYWSLSPQLRPWAIVQPRSAEEVSMVVKALVAVPECQFAIRRFVQVQQLDHEGTMLTKRAAEDTCHGLEPAISILESRLTWETWTRPHMTQLLNSPLFSLVENGRTSTRLWRKVSTMKFWPSQILITNQEVPEGVMVAGGREGLVGVAGLLLGGGVSRNMKSYCTF